MASKLPQLQRLSCLRLHNMWPNMEGGAVPDYRAGKTRMGLEQGSIPGRYESFWKEVDHVKNILKNRQELKVENAGIAALFGLECLAWFYGGEIVGRGFTFTGYHV
uniref:ATP synthase subunit n=1 Tax=Fagus sylvatica TaxID=28930 RepID=A0A2N9HU21_FAGSY